MAEYYTLVLYFHSPAARENTHAISSHIAFPPIKYYICSAQSENLRNLEIALRILRIPRLRSNLEIAQAIWRLRNTCAQSGDCVTRVRNLRTLPVHPTVSDLLCSSQDGRHP